MNKPTALTLALGSLALLGAGGMIGHPPRHPDAKPPHGIAKGKVNFADHVAPILNKNCVECHRPGEVAPFSLIGYANAKKWASTIANVTGKRQMPPWKAVPGFGEFQDEKRLTQEDIETLKNWSEAGAPRGNSNREPKPPTFTSEWPLGTPDLILNPEKAFHVDAEGADVYRNFVLKTKSDKPMFVKAMAVRPGNPKIVHHVIVFLDNYGAAAKLETDNHDGQEGYTTFGGVGFLPSGSLGGWAPGLRARETPPGVAFRVEPGATLVLQVHYHKDGKPEEDLTKVGLYLAKEPVQSEMQLAWFLDFGLKIPAGDNACKLSVTRRIPADVTIYGAMPHMHLLGKSMKATVEFPDGTTKPLVFVDNWDFNWQMSYAFKQPMKVPKGSKIHIEAVYDNSPGNARNPHNPPKTVTWGEQTTDEMFLLIVPYTVDRPFTKG